MRQTQKSFTLIETLLYVGIAGMALAAIVSFAWNMMGLGAKQATYADAISGARLAADRLSFFIREATDIDAANSNFGVNLAAVPGSKITLRAAAPDDPTVIDVSGGMLRIAKGAASPVALFPSNVAVSSIVFSSASSVDGKSKNIGFEMIVGSSSPSGRFEFSNTTTVRSSAELRSIP